TNSTGKYLVSGLVSPSTTGSYNIKALFATTSLYAAVNSTVQTLTVTPAPTTLTLNSISSPAWGKNVTVTGQLTITSSGTGVGGKTITFSGNGTANLQPVTTNPDGTFSVTGAAPNTVATGWQINANFAGDSFYLATFSTQNYNTLIHSTSLTLAISPQPVGT